MPTLAQAASSGKARKKSIFSALYVQVLIGIVVGILLGHFSPDFAEKMRPFGDGFIKLVKMLIGFVVFFTVVSGLSGMQDIKKVGRVGGLALIYFEIITTVALLLGMAVGVFLRPGDGFGVPTGGPDASAMAQYVSMAHAQSIQDFLLNIIPTTVLSAFTSGDILPVIFISILFGYVLARMGERGRPIRELIDAGTSLVFGAIGVLMRLAPIGAFGAMAFTIGRYGLSSLLPLVWLIGCFYVTSILFVMIVLGVICRLHGFRIVHLLSYIKQELLIVLGTSSSDSVLPALVEKLEAAGCSKSTVGLVVPTGYVFNADGTCIYMTMAVLFVAQAMGVELSLLQQIAIFGVAALTTKGSAGVTGAGFVALVSTVSVIPSIPVAGLALILGIDRFISEGRALVNVIGNAVAALVVARWQGELDTARLDATLRNAAS